MIPRPLLAAALLVPLLAACGAAEDEPGQWASEPPPFPEVVMIRRLQPDRPGDPDRLRGRLVVRDGCLRALADGGESWLLLWPAEARLSVAAAHDVSVDGEPGKGQQMIRVGEAVELGGRDLGQEATARIGPARAIAASAAVPAACPGPVWAVNSFGPSDG